MSKPQDAPGLHVQPGGRRESIIGKKNPHGSNDRHRGDRQPHPHHPRQKVMLDSGLATLYGVETRRLNEQVRRNAERFPRDFVFQISSAEWDSSRSQFATLKTGRGQHRKYLPYAFTEHGALMSAMVLNSPRATGVSVYVVRAFVQLRDMLVAHKELAKRLDELEAGIERKLDTHDQAIASILDAIRSLMTPPEPGRRPIGFVNPDEKGNP